VTPLGWRETYGRYRLLGKAVHDDYHRRTLLLSMDARFDRDAATQREPLPAGPETATYISPGKRAWGSHDFPRPGLVAAIDRRAQLARDVEQLLEGVVRLREYEPDGAILFEIVRALCFEGHVRWRQERGWRHDGDQLRALQQAGGMSYDQLNDALARAWGVIAVIAVAPEVLERARQFAGAVDERALQWAEATG